MFKFLASPTGPHDPLAVALILCKIHLGRITCQYMSVSILIQVEPESVGHTGLDDVKMCLIDP